MTIAIENGVELPPELPAKKPRKPRARREKTAKAPSSVSQLIQALKFVSVAQKKSGTTEQQFCAMTQGWLVANNGILTVATKIEETLNTCPHTYQLLDALNKTGDDVNITQLNEATLSVKSDKFKALIPCCTIEELSLGAPDPVYMPVDNRLKDAFEAVMDIATDGAEVAHLAAVLLQPNTTVATNNAVIMEYWHGLPIPGEFMVPKSAAAAVVDSKKDLTGIGFGASSVTFYFADESIIKTQLYADRFPAYGHLLNVESNAWPLPEEFFKAVRAVESFSKDGIVHFDNNVVSSREVENEATTYKVEGVPDGMAFVAKYLLKVEAAMKTAHFDKEANNVLFFGDNVRGLVLAVNQTESYQPVVEEA